MRLVSFNLWSGRTLLPRGPRSRPEAPAVDLDRLRAAVVELAPDVLALQEVDRRQSRSQHADLAEVAAEAMGATDVRFVPTLSGTPGPMWIRPTPAHLPQGEYGIALLSRLPVLAWSDIGLPSLRPSFRLMLPSARGPLLVGEEPRAAIVAYLDTPAGCVVVVNTHLTWVPGSSIRQLQQIARHLQTVTEPVIVMGDLNMWGGLPERVTGYRPLAVHLTYPGARPRRQLDHILLRGELGRVIHSEAVQLGVSDHRALVVDLDLGGE